MARRAVRAGRTETDHKQADLVRGPETGAVKGGITYDADAAQSGKGSRRELHLEGP